MTDLAKKERRKRARRKQGRKEKVESIGQTHIKASLFLPEAGIQFIPHFPKKIEAVRRIMTYVATTTTGEST